MLQPSASHRVEFGHILEEVALAQADVGDLVNSARTCGHLWASVPISRL